MRRYGRDHGFTQWALPLLFCGCVEEGGSPSSSEAPLADDLPDTVSSADTPPDAAKVQAPEPAHDAGGSTAGHDSSALQTSDRDDDSSDECVADFPCFGRKAQCAGKYSLQPLKDEGCEAVCGPGPCSGGTCIADGEPVACPKGTRCDYLYIDEEEDSTAFCLIADASTREALCGNGSLDLGEFCDDGNENGGDGCNECQIEKDWRCEPGFPCISFNDDQPCNHACWDEGSCLEQGSFVTCRCPQVQPDACGEIHFRALPKLPGRGNCIAFSVSADGSTFVGSCYDDAWKAFPVVWRKGAPPERLDEAGTASAVNHDGSIIGLGGTGTPFQLVPPAQPMTDVEFAVSPSAIADDGAWVVGASFIWSIDDDATALKAPDGEGEGIAYDASRDGHVVGSAAEGETSWAAAWALDGEGRWLPKLEGATASVVRAVSGDGSVSVGAMWFGQQSEGVRWTSKGAESIGPDDARAISADGKTIFGADHEGIWLYDDDLGVRRLKPLLEDLGVVLDDWSGLFVNDVSADGRTLAGLAQYLGEDQTNHAPRPFVVYLP